MTKTSLINLRCFNNFSLSISFCSYLAVISRTFDKFRPLKKGKHFLQYEILKYLFSFSSNFWWFFSSFGYFSQRNQLFGTDSWKVNSSTAFKILALFLLFSLYLSQIFYLPKILQIWFSTRIKDAPKYFLSIRPLKVFNFRDIEVSILAILALSTVLKHLKRKAKNFPQKFSDKHSNAKRLILAIAKCIMTLPETKKIFISAIQPQ